MISNKKNLFQHSRSGSNLVLLDIGNLEDKTKPSIIKGQKPKLRNAATQTDSRDVIHSDDKMMLQIYKVGSDKQEVSTEIIDLRKDYEEILERNKLKISDLVNGKDFLWNELKYIKDTYLLFESKENTDLDWNSELGYRSLNVSTKDISPAISKAPIDIQEKEQILCSIMALRKKTLQEQYERDKQAVLDRVEIEKDIIRDEIATECECEYTEEIKYLKETIQGLQETLEDLKKQKDDLEKIFKGERNALELTFARREQELRNKMARNFQRELIKAHQDWTDSRV